jgi:putative inorganic carbon (HCO3(-)) transporter
VIAQPSARSFADAADWARFSAGRMRLWTIQIALFAVAGVAATKLGAYANSTHEWAALSAGLVATVALLIASLTNFKYAVLGMLFLRATLDSFHGASSVDPAMAVGILFLLFATFWLLRRVAKDEMQPISRTVYGIMTLGLVALALSVKAYSFIHAFGGSIRIMSGAIMLLVLEQFISDDWRMAERLQLTVLGSASIPIMVSVYQWSHHQGGFVDSSGFSRISGTFVHPDSFATYLGMALVMGYAVFGGQLRRFAGAAIFTTGLLALVLTYSRGGWLACIAGIVMVTWRTRRRLFVPLLLAGVLAAVIVPTVTSRIANARSNTHPKPGVPSNSLSWRIQYWQTVSHLFFSHPATGVGLGAVKYIEVEGVQPHNIVVQVAAEMGIVGLTGLGFLAFSVRSDLRRARRRVAEGLLERRYAVIAGAATLVVVIQALNTNVLLEAVIYWYWAALIAPATAYRGPPPKQEPAPAVA